MQAKRTGSTCGAANATAGRKRLYARRTCRAVRQKADVFLVPAGENYEEALKEAKRKNYSIKIEAVSTFDEALKKLKKI